MKNSEEVKFALSADFLDSEDGLSALIIETRHSCEIFVDNIAGWKVRVGHDHKFWGHVKVFGEGQDIKLNMLKHQYLSQISD